MRRPGKFDYALLATALVLGSVATLRRFGVGGVTIPAAVLLGGAVLLALRPLMRLFGGGEGMGARPNAVIAVVFGAHFVATLFFFPPEDVVNDRPVLTLDHAVHFYQAERAKAVSSKALPFTVYDPYFMGGHPGGMSLDIDSKGVEAWCSLLRMLDTARSYKLFIFLTYLLIVFSVYGGCRRLRFGFEESIYAVLVLLACWHWGRPYASHFRFAGMFSYVLGFHLSFYLMGLVRSFFDEERVRRLYVLGPLALFIHPTAAVLLPVPILALFLAGRRRLRDAGERRLWQRRRLFKLAVWVAFVAAGNAFWLLSFSRYLDFDGPHTGFFQIHGLGALLGVLLKAGNLPALVLIALAVVGGVHLARTRRWADAAAPAAGSAFLLFLSAFGVYLPLVNQMEPGRFLVPALLFMAPLAGAGAARAVSEVERLSHAPEVVRVARAAIAVTLLVSSPALALVASRGFYRHTLTTSFTPEVHSLIETLKRRIDPSGRLMIEDGPAWAYGDCLLPAILPLETGVEQIGGPYPYGFLPHHFATFRTCTAFGTPLAEAASERLHEYLALYNVHWILTATDECRAAIVALPYVRLLWSEGAFALWGVAPVLTFASEAGVAVRASYNLIQVTIAPEGGRSPDAPILLKYHWDPGLEVEAPARISPQMHPDDPVPFILLDPRGERDIRIVFR